MAGLKSSRTTGLGRMSGTKRRQAACKMLDLLGNLMMQAIRAGNRKAAGSVLNNAGLSAGH
jgi:hypothetical protein